MNWIKSMKVNDSLTAVLCAILGVVLLVWPGQSIQIACMVLGVVLSVYGAVQILLYFFTKDKTLLSHSMMIFGIVLLVIGIFIILKPDSIRKAIPMIVGILIVIHGLRNAIQAVELKKMNDDHWWAVLLLAVLTMAVGVVLICNPFAAIDMAVRVIGICLLYDGLSNLWIQSRVFKTKRTYERVIDTEGVIVEEGTTGEDLK